MTENDTSLESRNLAEIKNLEEKKSLTPSKKESIITCTFRMNRAKHKQYSKVLKKQEISFTDFVKEAIDNQMAELIKSIREESSGQ